MSFKLVYFVLLAILRIRLFEIVNLLILFLRAALKTAVASWVPSLNIMFSNYLVFLFCVLEFLEKQIHAFVAKLSDRCFCWFPAAMLVAILMGTSMVSPYKSL